MLEKRDLENIQKGQEAKHFGRRGNSIENYNTPNKSTNIVLAL
jgi:hypothetical protein